MKSQNLCRICLILFLLFFINNNNIFAAKLNKKRIDWDIYFTKDCEWTKL